MRTLIVILGAPLLKDDLCFEQAAEEFAVEALIAQLVVEALDVTVLPRRARPNVDGLDRLLLEPVLDRVGDELRAIVAACQNMLTDPYFPFLRGALSLSHTASENPLA